VNYLTHLNLEAVVFDPPSYRGGDHWLSHRRPKSNRWISEQG